MADPTPTTGTVGQGIRVVEAQTGHPMTVDAERAHADFVAGKLRVVDGFDYTMVDAEGGVWDIPAKSVSQAINAGYKFGTRLDGVRAEAADPNQAWRAAADGALNGLSMGTGDAIQERLGLSAADEIQARAEAHPAARMAGSAGGIAAQMLLTGGLSAGSLVGRGAVEALAERGASAAVQRVAAAGVSGAVDGALYGAGEGLSEAALGKSDEVAEHIIAGAGAGMLLGGGAGVAVGGLGVLGRAGRARLRDYATLYAKGAGKEAPAGLPEILRAHAEGRPADYGRGLELAAKDLRAALAKVKPEPVMPAPKTPAKPPMNIRDYAAQADTAGPWAAAPARAPIPADFVRGGEVDSAKVYRFVRNLGGEPNASKEEALRGWLDTLDEASAAPVRRALDGAHAIAGLARAEREAMAAEASLGELPAWSGRAVGAAAGAVVAGPVGAGIGGAVGGMVANRVVRPLHAAAQRAAVQRVLADVTERMGQHARVLVGVDKAVSATARAAERLVPTTAAMLHAESETARDEAFAARAGEVLDLADNPMSYADHLQDKTGHLDEAIPDTVGVLHVRAAEALAYLSEHMPTVSPADPLSDSPPRVSPHDRDRWGRIDAAIQDPLRAMRPGATGEEIRAVQAVYPKLYGSMQAEIAKAITPAVGWDQRKRLSSAWGLQLHRAFQANHVRILQNMYAPPPRGPGRPPKPKGRTTNLLTETDKLTYGL